MRDRWNVAARDIELLYAKQPILVFCHENPPPLPQGRHEKHVWRILVQIEILADVLSEHAWGERPKTLAKLDLEIQYGLHLLGTRITKNTAGAERPRAEFHATLEPSNHFLLSQEFSGSTG